MLIFLFFDTYCSLSTTGYALSLWFRCFTWCIGPSSFEFNLLHGRDSSLHACANFLKIVHNFVCPDIHLAKTAGWDCSFSSSPVHLAQAASKKSTIGTISPNSVVHEKPISHHSSICWNCHHSWAVPAGELARKTNSEPIKQPDLLSFWNGSGQKFYCACILWESIVTMTVELFSRFSWHREGCHFVSLVVALYHAELDLSVS